MAVLQEKRGGGGRQHHSMKNDKDTKDGCPMQSTVGKADEAKERALRSSAGSSSGGERKSHEHSCIATSALCTNRASLTVR